ncbi:MAG: type II toxin-antitoxin system death-on-curing family toxin [Candidatus Dadabacteria bacterium]|nr:type II toxin-antitoxin system death-on-curing family toxin [Candidatus Dadabacteria bacterium]MDE0477736.1 type II toxin-antitoxin system death-on-curing family toxin [Candidatus Dadabacteria bacterium]
MKYLSPERVIAMHEQVVGPDELQGIALNKSIESVLARVENRVAYEMIEDVFELAACYACCIAVGHAFNDGNKRTAFKAMDTCLTVNGIELDFDTVEAGEMMIKVAQGIVDEKELAEWLRTLVR